jgi:UDP-2,3-diacylglucosamine hydrolase
MARLFVSDVHLDAEAPQAIEQFLDFLSGEAAGAEALYILGDLFEAWVGDDDRDPQKARVCAALAALADSGVACFVLHGNRDFLLGAGFAARSRCRLLPDPVVAEFDGERVLLTHGDALCVDDHSYQELRTLVRAPVWQRRFLALPLAHRELLAGELRAGSRQHIGRTVPYIMDVNQQAVLAALRAAGSRRVIHGHTHRLGVHDFELDGAAAQRIVLGAWYEEGSYLHYERGSYQLRELPR